MLKLKKEVLDQLVNHVVQHLDQIDACMTDRRALWDEYINQYKVRRKNDNKTFPWEGCSNLFIPEVFGEVSTITSFMLTNSIRQDPPFTFTSLYGTDEDEKEAYAWERLYGWYLKNVMNHVSYWRKHTPFCVLLGTHVTKMGFEASGALGWPTVVCEAIALHRFYAYPSVKNHREAPIIGDMAWTSPTTLVKWLESGYLTRENYDKVRSVVQVGTQMDVIAPERDEDGSIPIDYVAIYDMYVRYQLDGPYKAPKLLRVVLHRDTQTPLWVEDWTEREVPYEIVRWIPDEDSLYGMGVGDLIWMLQDGYNTATNQAIDNATVANTRMIAAPPGSNLNPDERVYPGKIVISPMAEKIRPWPMGDVYPSAWMMPNMMKQAMQTASGASDSLQGMPDNVAKTRHTLGGQMLNLQYGGSRLDLNSAEMEEGLTDIAWHSLRLLVRYASGYQFDIPPMKDTQRADLLETLLSGSDSGDISSMLRARLVEEDAARVERVIFEMPAKILQRARYEIRPSHKFANKQTEREAALMLSQVVEKYLKGVAEIAGQLAQLQTQPQGQLLSNTLIEIWKATNRAMKRVLVSFSTEDAADLIVELQEVQNVLGGTPPVAAAGPGEMAGAADQLQQGVPGIGELLGLAGGAGQAFGSQGGSQLPAELSTGNPGEVA